MTNTSGTAEDKRDMREKIAVLKELEDDCRVLLRNWRFRDPIHSAASPDAVLAIAELSNQLRTQVSQLELELIQLSMPF